MSAELVGDARHGPTDQSAHLIPSIPRCSNTEMIGRLQSLPGSNWHARSEPGIQQSNLPQRSGNRVSSFFGFGQQQPKTLVSEGQSRRKASCEATRQRRLTFHALDHSRHA